jgi:hypothetical protein
LRTLVRALVAILIVTGAAGSQAEDEQKAGLTHNASALSDSELDARLRFLEEHLDDGETWAKNWQWGWTGGYSVGIVYGTARAIASDHQKNRINFIVTAAKAVIGTSRLLFWRHPGRNGADSMRAVEGDSREARLARLEEGEVLLQAVAKRAEQRTDWRAHAGNIGLNLAGAGFIFGFGHTSDAWESLGVGILVGELNIWTAPKRGIQDLSDYQTRFGMKTASRFHWTIVPTMGGAAVMVTF